jgi:hypothetical protein
VVDGKTNMIKVVVGGINDIKYPTRNNHGSLIDFIQPEAMDMIKHGIPRMINADGPISRFFCC